MAIEDKDLKRYAYMEREIRDVIYEKSYLTLDETYALVEEKILPLIREAEAKNAKHPTSTDN